MHWEEEERWSESLCSQRPAPLANASTGGARNSLDQKVCDYIGQLCWRMQLHQNTDIEYFQHTDIPGSIPIPMYLKHTDTRYRYIGLYQVSVDLYFTGSTQAAWTINSEAPELCHTRFDFFSFLIEFGWGRTTDFCFVNFFPLYLRLL